MLTKLESAVNAWGGSNPLVDQWLGSRKELLIHYCQLAGLPPYNKEIATLPSESDIKQFCNQLVDYVSAGHFEIYDQIASACEKNGPRSRALADAVLPKISSSTDVALDFNDKYTNGVDEEALMQLDQELSTLGQAMEERFEFEDQLLESLYSHHSEAAAS